MGFHGTSIMRMYGLDIPIKQEGELKVFQCPRCKRNTPVGSTYCPTCGLPLNDNQAAQLEKERTHLESDWLKTLIQDPEFMAFMENKFNK